MKKNDLQKDPRIDASSFRWGEFGLVFLLTLTTCGIFLLIYSARPASHENGGWIALGILAYLVALSFLLALALMLTRRHFLLRPLRAMQSAVRRVAQGDFSVRIPPQRRDGKRDEFEVMYEDINTMAAELASTEMLKKDFISNVSHELKTPVAVIQNYASILQSDSLTEDERKDYAQRIGAAATRLSGLVGNILQLSRLENQKVAPQCAAFNLSEQLCRCAIGFERLLDEKDIELVTRLDQNVQLISDEGLLDIVWNNLLSNAIKFTPPGGTVCIEARAEGAQAVVCIEDTGCGVSAQALPHIFDKFYQEESSHTTQGNGLGLAMVRQVTQLLHGSVQAESQPGQGARFTVRLPLRLYENEILTDA